MMFDINALKESIETEANRLGFTHMGIAPAIQPPHYEQYLNWIGSGKHADMSYLSRTDAAEKRGDPGIILEGCKSIISLAMPYQPSQAKPSDTPPGKGRISAYALTKDYHQVMWDKLVKLEDFIRSQMDRDVRLKSYVDTGPVLERDYASLAGIGIAGKNTCVIIPGIGSFFFLAEILTDLELPIDPPYQSDICGSCRRCIDACPTGSILENREIDANRCISYLTIENKGVIPDELKGKIGDWVFGCDICQNVCPHNAQTPEQLLSLGSPLLPEFIDLIELFSFDEHDFAEKFTETPLTRVKRDGLLRNAAVVLGNQGVKKALPVLKQALEREQNPAIKDACHWAIEKIKQHDRPHSHRDEY